MPDEVALVTRDPAMVAAVRPLAAMAGVDVQVTADATELNRWWRAARVVVVDAALAGAVAAHAPGRRESVVVVTDAVQRVEVWQAAMALGASAVVGLPGGERELLDLVTASGEPAGAAGPVVGVWPAHGGAGASTLAVAVAVRAPGPGQVGLVDADADGGGLDLLLGAERVAGARWPDLGDVRGMVASRRLADALPQVGTVQLLAHGRGPATSSTPEAMSSVLAALRRGGGRVVVDLPRRLDDAASTAARACSALFVVVTPQVRAVAAAAGAVEVASRCCADVRVVVRQIPQARLRPSEVADALGAPVAAVVPHVAAVPVAADRGDLAGAVLRKPFDVVDALTGDVAGWVS